MAHADPYYRRTFGEVRRRRSLFFLGSGPSDPYLLELFSEIQEIYGTTPQPHFAIVAPDSEVDVEHLRSRFNILVARLDDINDLHKILTTLGAQIASRHTRQVQWSWQLHSDPTNDDQSADLTIRHGALPETSLGAHEGIVVSAGLKDAALNVRTPFVLVSDETRALEREAPGSWRHPRAYDRFMDRTYMATDVVDWAAEWARPEFPLPKGFKREFLRQRRRTEAATVGTQPKRATRNANSATRS